MRVLVLALIALVLADDPDDNSGRYVPSDDGRYIPDNSGQYIPDYSGLYKDDGTGRYSGDDSGRYSGQNADNLFGAGTSRRQVVQPIVPPSTTTTPRPTPPPAQFKYDNYKEGNWKIIRQFNDIDTDGGYHWEYETENKISAEESGKLYNVGTDAEGIRAKGFFQYTGPDNVVYSIVYTADENGFIPVGDHIPTPPPIPEAIARALAYNEADERSKNRV